MHKICSRTHYFDRYYPKLMGMADYQQVLPNMAPEAFQIDKQIEQRLREDPQVYENFKNFPALYQRVRIDTIQSVLQQPELFQRRLDKFIACTKANQMYGQWHDGGRLLEV
ncbi:hypothetical protein C812_01464 [Paenibacillus barengoltzii G22]|uniref:Uncharacterized protein n=1 Tax=Paenibacillus barengoltzii G22 TaxID=1235795 RepID=R9LEC9_9BACL|nr:hypothetical protein C812_01464 [Paenibacillus barengoltzii G22]